MAGQIAASGIEDQRIRTSLHKVSKSSENRSATRKSAWTLGIALVLLKGESKFYGVNSPGNKEVVIHLIRVPDVGVRLIQSSSPGESFEVGDLDSPDAL